MDERLIPLTASEVQRLLTRLVWTANYPRSSFWIGCGGGDTTKPWPNVATTNGAYHGWSHKCNCSTKVRLWY